MLDFTVTAISPSEISDVREKLGRRGR